MNKHPEKVFTKFKEQKKKKNVKQNEENEQPGSLKRIKK